MEEIIVYTVKDVARLLHTSPNYVYKLISCGFIPVIKIGSLKILKTSLEKFLTENEGNDFSDLNNVNKIDLSNIGDGENG
jgi:excisionase family DNA binding protein